MNQGNTPCVTTTTIAEDSYFKVPEIRILSEVQRETVKSILNPEPKSHFLRLPPSERRGNKYAAFTALLDAESSIFTTSEEDAEEYTLSKLFHHIEQDCPELFDDTEIMKMVFHVASFWVIRSIITDFLHKISWNDDLCCYLLSRDETFYHDLPIEKRSKIVTLYYFARKKQFGISRYTFVSIPQWYFDDKSFFLQAIAIDPIIYWIVVVDDSDRRDRLNGCSCSPDSMDTYTETFPLVFDRTIILKMASGMDKGFFRHGITSDEVCQLDTIGFQQILNILMEVKDVQATVDIFRRYTALAFLREEPLALASIEITGNRDITKLISNFMGDPLSVVELQTLRRIWEYIPELDHEVSETSSVEQFVPPDKEFLDSLWGCTPEWAIDSDDSESDELSVAK